MNSEFENPACMDIARLGERPFLQNSANSLNPKEFRAVVERENCNRGAKLLTDQAKSDNEKSKVVG
jgi:hypothetical protein